MKLKTINRQCTAITKKGKNCPIKVEEWRELDFCHVHDPNGKFRKQMSNKGYKTNVYVKTCKHTWYMREPGIICTKCLIVWEKGME